MADIGVTIFRQTYMGMDQNLEDYNIYVFTLLYIYISHIWRDGHPFTGCLDVSRRAPGF